MFSFAQSESQPSESNQQYILHRRHGGVPLEGEPYATSCLFRRHCSDAASRRCPQRVRRTTSSSTALAPPVNRQRRQQSVSADGGRGGRGDALCCRRIDCRVFLRSDRGDGPVGVAPSAWVKKLPPSSSSTSSSSSLSSVSPVSFVCHYLLLLHRYRYHYHHHDPNHLCHDHQFLHFFSPSISFPDQSFSWV